MSVRLFLILAATAILPLAQARTPAHFNIPLWERGKVPFVTGDGPLDAPFLTVFLPPEGQRNGTSVIIAPGGSNIMLMYGLEGLDIAERFNDWGAAAFVLTYRLSPRYNDDARSLDGNRAIRLVRARAKEWGLDPSKIGLAGFSAGSSLARLVAATAKDGNLSALDPIERASSRANWLVMVYGPGRALPTENLKTFPPTFLLSAARDDGAAGGTAQFFLDLNRAGAVAELHIYQKGRHGFGAATHSAEFAPWMDALRHFLVQGGFLKNAN